MNETQPDLLSDLRDSLNLYRDLLRIVETENQTLRQAAPDHQAERRNPAARKPLLPRLDDSLQRLRQHRTLWLQLAPAERNRQPQIGALLRQCQDTIMRVLLLDRENEQALLRQGLLNPRHLPSHQSQRPHFVASLYRRAAGR